MKNLMILLGAAMVLLSCVPTSVAVFQSGNDFKSAVIVNRPPDEASTVKDLTSLNGYHLRKLTISPKGLYCVVSLAKQSSTFPWQTRVVIYSPLNGRFIDEFSNANIKSMIERQNSFNYPAKVLMFITFDVRWMDSQRVVLEIQPGIEGTGSDVTPLNVSLLYNIATKKVEQAEYYERGDASPIIVPSHPSKTMYTTSLDGGKLYIEGNEVRNIPGNITVVDHAVMVE